MRGAMGRHRPALIVGLLAITRAPVADPSEGQTELASHIGEYSMFSDPVAENLTGLPARIFYGESATPQVLVAMPTLAQVDPVIGISPSGAGRYPSLPSRRPPNGLALP